MTDETTKKMLPYWQYKTAGDGHVRETHQAMAERVFPADDPIWDVWYPLKLFHGIRKRDETAVCDFHEGLIPFLAGQLLVGRGGPLYHLHIAGLKNK